MSGDEQIDRQDCYICGRGNPDILERHHIVPKRHGGSDDPANLVDLCPSCHRALETLYGDRFYKKLGVGTVDELVEFVASYVALRIHDIELEVSMALEQLRSEVEDEFGHGYSPELEDELRDALNRYHTPSVDSDDDGEPLFDDDGDRKMFVKETIHALQKSREGGVPLDEIYAQAAHAGMDDDMVSQILEELRKTGEIYEPERDRLKAI